MQNKGSNFKWFVCFLLFLITAINYMDRQVIGLLKGTLSEQFQWDEYDFSYIIMGFQCAYAVGSFLMGYLIDKVGVRKGFVIVAFFWSVATAAHALASSVLGFLLARIMLGLFEGGNFPAAVRAVSTNFPKSERALANGLFNSGSNVGAIVAPLLIPLIAAFHSWQASFVTLGLLGLVWIAIWYFSYGEKPAANFADEAEEEQVEPQKKVSWLKLLTYGSSWAYIVGMAMSGPIWWFYLFWTPNFLEKNYNASLSDIAAPLALIYSIACVGSVGGGWISSELIKRGKSVNFSRKIALLICACCVCPVAFAQS
ncbi:MAG: MFS transporter, partial [Opitutales bacterium]|nr:MFS transporter [Opitutales bacterium]